VNPALIQQPNKKGANNMRLTKKDVAYLSECYKNMPKEITITKEQEQEFYDFINKPITHEEYLKSREEIKQNDKKRKRLIREEYRLKMLYKTQGFI